ncbi:MAG: SRPBCC family protein [Syntrophothermus sp.]
MSIFQINKQQIIPAPLDTVWDFISAPKNLKEITPPSMGFDIVSKDLPEKMYPGMIIMYKVKPFPGMKVTWVTEITQVAEKKFFIDEQRSGPYAMWHHQHILEPAENGVLMKDIITYKPPFWFLGNIANYLIIAKKLEGIFEFREKKLKERFF